MGSSLKSLELRNEWITSVKTRLQFLSENLIPSSLKVTFIDSAELWKTCCPGNLSGHKVIGLPGSVKEYQHSLFFASENDPVERSEITYFNSFICK